MDSVADARMEERTIPNSSQLQSAMDQLTYLQRIVYGDDDMSLNDLLASASASGPSSSLPLGGLSKALPALLSPLLPSGEKSTYQLGSSNALSQSQQSLLAKRAAFQPRRYLAMTAELISRISDDTGEMHRAVQLAQSLIKQSDQTNVKSSQWQKILQQRKARKVIDGQDTILAGQTAPFQQKGTNEEVSSFTFHSKSFYMFPSALHGKAKEMEPALVSEPDKEVMKRFIKAWQQELSVVDEEASLRIQVILAKSFQSEQSDQRTGRRGQLLRIRIDQTGHAWLWLHFMGISKEEWYVKIDRVHLLAESEVEESKIVSVAIPPSKFPLYRRITSLLHTKLLQLERQTSEPWAHLTISLFALASLCRLNDLRLSSNFPLPGVSTQLQGQESILNAFLHFGVSKDKRGDRREGDETKDNRQEDSGQSPQSSALFSDSHFD